METALEEVVFCILENHNAGKWHNPRGDIEHFREAFGKGLREQRRQPPDGWEPTGKFKQRRRG
eukprot:10303682-Alexandrium_andersonii.AAC.1